MKNIAFAPSLLCVFYKIAFVTVIICCASSAFAQTFTSADISGDAGGSFDAVMGDVNDDGFLDIYVANTNDQNKLWINDGNGNFTADDISGDIGYSQGAVMGDVNDDGFLDIYVANYGEQNKLWINDGNGNFTANDIFGDLGDSWDAVMGDINGDTYLDIYVTNASQQNKLWINDGSGDFTADDISGDIGYSYDAAMGDVNGDTYLDIYVAHGGLQNKLWINDGSGNFTADDISGDIGYSIGAVMGDVNDDGFLDIYVANYEDQNKLWINDGSGNFTADDISGDLGSSYRTVMGDINGDGFLDIYVANASNEQNKLWINDGTGNFFANHISGDLGHSIGAAIGDVNDDGRLDIHVANNGTQNKLWIQDGNFTAGDGSLEDPYQITSCIELQSMEDELNAHYKLMNHIECADSATWNSGKGFDPVGTVSDPFTGSFNGQNFEIRDLYIERANDVEGEDPEDEDYVGLFGHTEGATTTNLSMVDTYVKGYRYVGAVIGYMDGGLIENVSVNWNATVDEDNDCLSPKICIWARWGQHGGGVIGYASDATISNIQSGGAVKGSGSNIGGVIGSAYDSEILHTSSTALVDGGQQIGGLIGYMSGGSLIYGTASGYVDGTSDGEDAKYNQSENIGGLLGESENASITLSLATGNVLGRSKVGGFIGLGDQMVITDAYAAGNVAFGTGSFRVGGFAGDLYNSTLTNVYARGNVSAPANFGGLVASVINTETNYSFWDIETSGTEDSAAGQGTSTTAMKTRSTFTNADWDFTTIWAINPEENDGYPFLRFQGLTEAIEPTESPRRSGGGTSVVRRVAKLEKEGEVERAQEIRENLPGIFDKDQTLKELQSKLFDLITRYRTLTGHDPVTNTIILGTRDLMLNDSGTDVELLQHFLIQEGYSIPAGITGFFGPQTESALAKFQAAKSIIPALGYYGPLTREKITTLYSKINWK